MAFIIKEHRPGRSVLLITVLALLWVVSVWLVYQYGWDKAVRLLDHEFEKSRPLHERLTDVIGANRGLRARIAVLERTAQVDREAKVELVQEIKELQGQAAELREEIAFYKLIISPGNGKDGLSVYSLEIMPASKNLYHFKVILTQVGKSSNLAEGEVDMTIEGIFKGQAKRLRLSDIQVPKDRKSTYKFQYFQELTGSLELPEGFIPREVVVKLTRNKGDEIENPVERFDWLKVRT